MESLLVSLLRASSTLLEDLARAPDPPERLLVRSDRTGTMQLYETAPGSEPRQLTALSEPVGGARYLPGGRRAILEVDQGGNERFQLYLMDLDQEEPVGDLRALDPLTQDPRHGHNLAGVSPDGSLVAYTSNLRNGVDFDLWICALGERRHTPLFVEGGWCEPASGFSPDGRWISVLRDGSRPLDVQLFLVEAASGRARQILAHPEAAAEVGAPAWAQDGTFFVAANVGREYSQVVRIDPERGVVDREEDTGAACDSLPLTSADGGTLLVVENRGGESGLWVRDLVAGGRARELPLPEPGVVVYHTFRPPILSADGSRVYYTLSGPRLVGDVWRQDLSEDRPQRLTGSPSSPAPERLVNASRAEATGFDGEKIPLFLFSPSTAPDPPPVVVRVHGGPESQAVLVFDPIVQGLVDAGWAVVVPNVRGSTGYGKRYAALDDTTKRLDSVRDLAAVHSWLSEAGLDSSRAALWGGSYGGYMVLAGLAFQPELWAAGVDIVGIASLVTFLENTSPYRRAHREREYGSLARDREFLESASPLTRSAEIRAPLFIIHGRNDPRVPVAEAQQLERALRAGGVRCALLIYEDEGHGLARLANRLDAFPKAVQFLAEVVSLGRDQTPSPKR
ncbi:MAG: S9 family peptidase [Candidatus Dormibacteria bacterium]